MTSRTKSFRFASLLLLLAGFAATSCGGEGTGSTNVVIPPPASVAVVEVSPGSATLLPAQTAQLSAVTRDASGQTLTGRAVTWASSAQAVATVDGNGLVTAVAPGAASVTATSEGRSGSASITVNAPAPTLARITLTPSTVALQVAQTVSLAAAGFDAAGNPMAGVSFSYSSSNTAIATVTQAGVVTAVANGTAVITVSSGTISATATVTVVQPPGGGNRITVTPTSASLTVGQTAQLTASVVDAQGNAVPGAIVQFVSSNTAVATVTNAGLVSGVAAGTALITVTGGNVSTVATITVTAATGANRITLTPTTASVAVGQTVQLTGAVVDAQGTPVPGATVQFASSNTSVASVSSAGLVTGVAAGSATVTASSGALTTTAAITVITPPSGNVVDVIPSQAFQTLTGWEAQMDAGHFRRVSPTTGCGGSFPVYGPTLLDRVVNEMGINRVRLELRSGTENPVNYLAQAISGQIDGPTWSSTWFQAVNDNADPFSADPRGFQWEWFDINVERSVLPLRQRLAARGERLFINLNYIDFIRGGVVKVLPHLKQPDEFGELILETFKHLQSKYGIVPDAFELVLEPEHTVYIPTDIGKALVAVAQRLRAAGFNPQFIGPSTTSMTNASIFYDEMMTVPGARGLLSELAYHRYVGVNAAALQAIVQRAQRDGIKTAMLEHINSGVDDLIEDLTVGNVSAWEKFAIADCHSANDLSFQATYYQINTSDPAAPIINITNDSRLLRQIFAYARMGAVRVGTASGSTAIKPVAFRNTNGRHMVAMRTTGPQTITVRGLPAGTYGINYSTLSSVNVSAADVTIGSGGTVTATIPAGGVITVFGK